MTRPYSIATLAERWGRKIQPGTFATNSEDFGMKCKTCVELGLKSTLEVVSTVSTLMCEHQFYDEDGRYHLHDPNITSTLYRCSNGHSTDETSSRHCPTCKPEETVRALG